MKRLAMTNPIHIDIEPKNTATSLALVFSDDPVHGAERGRILEMGKRK